MAPVTLFDASLLTPESRFAALFLFGLFEGRSTGSCNGMIRSEESVCDGLFGLRAAVGSVGGFGCAVSERPFCRLIFAANGRAIWI